MGDVAFRDEERRGPRVPEDQTASDYWTKILSHTVPLDLGLCQPAFAGWRP